jgi:ubiquinone biosynthesis protein
MRTLRLHLAYKNIKRLKNIISVFLKHGFHPLLERLHLLRLLSMTQRLTGKKIAREQAELTLAVRTRLAMEELGPTFIKFGQILSTRPDILSEEFVTEFLKLQDEIPPVPFGEITAVMEKEFKKPFSELFSSIEETPIAAASIAQVHRAITHSGDEVVVKVQRPGIENTIETDISILGYLAKAVARHIPESRIYDPSGMVDEFSRVIKRELDFTLEASYTQKFRDNFANDPRVEIPAIHWDMTTRRVLTMGRVEGIKVDRVGALKERGINTAKVAHLMAEIFFKQVFELGLFHGDLHSGNIFVISEDKIALVDFGIVGRVRNEMKARLADILICFAKDDFEGLTRVYMKMGILPEGIDRASFEGDYYDTMLHYFGRPLKHVKIGELMMDYIRMAGRHSIRFPSELLLFNKCLIELEGLARVLYPEVDILAESEPYAARLVKERVGPASVLKDAAKSLADYKELVEEVPAEIRRILKKISGDRLRIEFMHKGLEEFMGEIDRSSNRLTFGIIVAALVIGSSLVVSSRSASAVMGYPSLGVICFIIASVLGLWLIIQILRSGKF